MFKLVTIEDTIVVPAHIFGFGRTQTLEYVINKKMSDKVIPGVGLAVALWDLLSIGDDKLVRNSGVSTTLCRFRILVFSPFVGEAIFAHVGHSTSAGLLAYLGFFDLIWVPKEHLPQPSTFEDGDNVWVWRPKFDGETETPYYMDSSNETVLRITSVDYNDRPATTRSTDEHRVSNVMVIKASLYDAVSEDNQGLGDPRWWYEEPEEEEEVEQYDDGDQNMGDAGDEFGVDYEQNLEAEYQEGDGEQWGGDHPTDELIYEEGGEAAVDAEEDPE